jgi:flavodoxin
MESTQYKIWAHNSNPNENFQEQFESILNKLKQGLNFTFLRICDGEYFHLFLDIEIGGFHTHLDKDTSKKLVKELNYLIEQQKSDEEHLLIGIQYGTNGDKQFKEDINKKLSHLINKYSCSLWSWALVTNNMNSLFTALDSLQRPIIIVGCEYLHEPLSKKFSISKFVKTEGFECWHKQEELEQNIVQAIKETQNAVVLYACSVCGKMAMSKFYREYGNCITQIDMGAGFDTYANVNSRPWH